MILFKDSYAEKGWLLLHPITKSICESMGKWSIAYDNTPITLTETLSTPSRDKKFKRVSPSHSQGRAVDIRTRDWSKKKLIDFMGYFSEKFKQYGYLNNAGIRKLMIYHDSGYGAHLHVSIGIDIVTKYKNKYAEWSYPQHKKEVKNGMD